MNKTWWDKKIEGEYNKADCLADLVDSLGGLWDRADDAKDFKAKRLIKEVTLCLSDLIEDKNIPDAIDTSIVN